MASAFHGNLSNWRQRLAEAEDKWIGPAVKRPGRLRKILGMSDEEWESASKADKIAKINAALEKLAGDDSEEAKSKRGALQLGKRFIGGGLRPKGRSEEMDFTDVNTILDDIRQSLDEDGLDEEKWKKGQLGKPEVIHGMRFGTRYKYNWAIFIDEIHKGEGAYKAGEFHVMQSARPKSKKLGVAKSLKAAEAIARKKADFSDPLGFAEDTDDLDERYDPSEDPRKMSDEQLHKIAELVHSKAGMGGERKLGRGGYKKWAAVKKEMKRRGLKMRKYEGTDDLAESVDASVKALRKALDDYDPHGASVAKVKPLLGKLLTGLKGADVGKMKSTYHMVRLYHQRFREMPHGDKGAETVRDILWHASKSIHKMGGGAFREWAEDSDGDDLGEGSEVWRKEAMREAEHVAILAKDAMHLLSLKKVPHKSDMKRLKDAADNLGTLVGHYAE